MVLSWWVSQDSGGRPAAALPRLAQALPGKLERSIRGSVPLCRRVRMECAKMQKSHRSEMPFHKWGFDQYSFQNDHG